MERIRALGLNGATNLVLFDDTGAASGVTVSYARLASGFLTTSPTGTDGDLAMSRILTGTVTLSGLVDNASYDLAIYSDWDGESAFTVDGVTKNVTGGAKVDWAALTNGVQYVLFSVTADANGRVSFTPGANPNISLPGSYWSAFQLQSADPQNVPEPGSLWLLLGALGAMAGARRLVPAFQAIKAARAIGAA